MARPYPSQEEAQACLDLWNAVDNSFVGYCRDSQTAKIRLETLEALRGELQRIFNSPNTSPWELKEVRRKQQVSWRKDWELNAYHPLAIKMAEVVGHNMPEKCQKFAEIAEDFYSNETKQRS